VRRRLLEEQGDTISHPVDPTRQYKYVTRKKTSTISTAARPELKE